MQTSLSAQLYHLATAWLFQVFLPEKILYNNTKKEQTFGLLINNFVDFHNELKNHLIPLET